MSIGEEVNSSAADAGNPPDVTIIVVNFNTAHLLPRLFGAIEASRGDLSLQVIAVDNASSDGSAELLRARYPAVALMTNKTNVGFARANNQALPLARGRYVLLLNTDAFVSPDTLSKTVAFMDANPRYGILGVRLVGADGKLQPSCRNFPTTFDRFAASNRLGLWLRRRFFPAARLVDDFDWDHASVRECDWVPGCYYLIRRGVINDIGLFDPRFFLYFEEVDHCYRARQAGWPVVYYPHTQVLHIGGESAELVAKLTVGRQISESQIESELLYFRKHRGLAGVLNAVLLGTLGDLASAANALAVRGDRQRASGAFRHMWMQLKLLMATRWATNPTR